MTAAAAVERVVAVAELGERLSALRLADRTALDAMRASLKQHGQLSPVRAFAVVHDALLAEHSTLIDDFRPPSEQGRVVALAHDICRREASLRAVLARYRHAVREAAVPEPRCDADDDAF